MMYSSRLKKILEYCLQQDGYVTIEELAHQLKTSTRTIFRELKDIDRDLKTCGLTMHSKTGKGIFFEGNRVDKENLLHVIQVQGVQYVNKEERRNLLIFEVLRQEETQKLIHYANVFEVSEATISNDIDAIEPWFQTLSLTIDRKPGKGIELSGSEENVRRAMTSIVNKTITEDKAYQSVNYFDPEILYDQIFAKRESNSIMKLLNQEILERILDVFNLYHRELGLDRYAQISYIGLIIHLVIAIDRILKKEELSKNEDVIAMVEQDPCYIQAQRMASYLEAEFDIAIPDVETAFIALHLKGAKMSVVNYSTTESDEQQVLLHLVHEMIDQYDFEKRMYLSQDEELFIGLLTHLEPTIVRLKNHLPIYNPLLAQLKELYSDIFQQTKKACQLLEKKYECIVSEDEVGFVSMHIGASLERMKHSSNQKRIVSIGVVCASGIGVSALLSARLKKAFPQRVELSVLSMEEVLHGEYTCELLLSTFAIGKQTCPVIQVSPLLNTEDIVKIKQVVEQLQTQEVIPSTQASTKDFKFTLQQMREVSSQCLSLLEHLVFKHIPSTSTIVDMIDEVGRIYGETKEMEKGIVDSLGQREQLGSVIMDDYHFALLHAKTSGVKQCCLALFLPEHTCFEIKELAFVMVLLLPLAASKSQQALLSMVSRSVLEDDAFYQALCAKKTEEIEARLCDRMREYIRLTLDSEE